MNRTMLITDIENALANDNATLYANLARQFSPPALGMEERSDAELQEEGKEWIESNRGDLAKRICGSRVVAIALESKRVSDRVLVVAAVADLIASIVTGIAAITVAVLIVKEGFETLCNKGR